MSLPVDLKTRPRADQYAGLGYEAASRLMTQICTQAAQSGQTLNASYHLDALREVVERQREWDYRKGGHA